MIDTARLENLSTESRIVYSYFITNEYANIALGLAVDYLNLEFDFGDAVDQLAKEISDVIDGFTCEIMKDSDQLVQSLMIAAIDRIDFHSIAKILIEDYINQI